MEGTGRAMVENFDKMSGELENKEPFAQFQHPPQLQRAPQDRQLKRLRHTRFRMNDEQQQILEAEFSKSDRWSSKLVTQLAMRLQVKRRKVYKWCYDRRNRELNLMAAR